MNFLSHYYLDRHHPSAYFKLGLVLPDLVRGYNRTMRKAVAAHHPTLPQHQALKHGLQKHRDADRVFHALPQFAALQLSLKQELEKRQLIEKLPRSYFLAHVAIEMLIDKNLLKLYPQIHVEFYADLTTVSQPIVENYFAEIGCKPMASVFFDNFNLFTERRFLKDYPSDEKFTEILLMAWYRATGNKAGKEVRESLQEALLAVENKHAALLVSTLEIVNQQLKIAT